MRPPVPRIARPVRRHLTTWVVLALGVATAIALVATEVLKVDRGPIGSVHFDRVVEPGCDCPRAAARFGFRLRQDDSIDVLVVDADGDPVRTLADSSPRRKGPLTFRWAGRTDGGTTAPPGDYHVQVHLDRDDRTILIPRTVTVQAAA